MVRIGIGGTTGDSDLARVPVMTVSPLARVDVAAQK
jgi:hypothetical protein